MESAADPPPPSYQSVMNGNYPVPTYLQIYVYPTHTDSSVTSFPQQYNVRTNISATTEPQEAVEEEVNPVRGLSSLCGLFLILIIFVAFYLWTRGQ